MRRLSFKFTGSDQDQVKLSQSCIQYTWLRELVNLTLRLSLRIPEALKGARYILLASISKMVCMNHWLWYDFLLETNYFGSIFTSKIVLYKSSTYLYMNTYQHSFLCNMQLSKSRNLMLNLSFSFFKLVLNLFIY